MNIKIVTQIFFAHHRTFNMPARPTLTPRTLPAWLARFGRFPKRKIHRVTLLLAHAHTRSSQHILQITAGKLAIILKVLHGKINVAINLISRAPSQKLLHQGDNLRHMLRYAWMHISLKHIQSAHILKIGGNIFLRHRCCHCLVLVVVLP